MKKAPVIAIFDIGKTNKKFFLFQKQYQVVFEKTAVIPEIKDEDSFPCEDLEGLCSFIYNSLREGSLSEEFEIKAVNFSAYGASFIYIDKTGNITAPLYNYLKPYPEQLKRIFYDTYGGETKNAEKTTSPPPGSLNFGKKLYRFKN